MLGIDILRHGTGSCDLPQIVIPFLKSLGEDIEKESEKKQKIMDTPLPLILDEIETAAANARKAADEARIVGEKAAEDVMKRPRKLFPKIAKDITEELQK